MTDRYTCVDCGRQIPELLVDGPIAGDGTEYDAVDRCGGCTAEAMFA